MEETGRIYEALGPRLVRLWQERGLSQQELARALHVTRQAVSNWERGKTVPDVGTLCRLGEILQVDWNGLCGEMAPPPRRRRRFVLPVVMALAVCLTAAGIWGGVHLHRTDTAETDQQENLRLRAVMRSSDGVTVFHGSVRLTLTVTRREYDRDRNPVRRDLTLDLTAAEGQLRFQSVVWEAE